MRVAHVVATYPPYRGGLGNVAHAYVEGLRARGHDVEVFTTDYGHASPPPGHVHRLRSLVRVGQLALLPQLARQCAGFDVVHLHFPFFGAAQFLARARARRQLPNLVLTYHMDAHARGLRGAVFALHRRVLLPLIVRQADRILVSSHDYAQAAALWRVPDVRARIEEHPFGVDVARFCPGDAAVARAALGLASAPTIAFVGGLDRAHAFKGLGVLLTAMAQLPATCRLVVVGDGDLRAGYAQQAQSLGLGERVRFLGSLDDAALPQAYRAADVVAFPSVSRAEAFGLVALEAAACGKPVVASNLPGVRTVVRDGETGVLVPPAQPAALANALADLLQQGERRRQLGRAARARVERELSWDHAIDRLLSSYAAVLATNGAR